MIRVHDEAIALAARYAIYLDLAAATSGNQKTAAIRRAGECAAIALKYPENRPGFQEAAISRDGILLVLVRARPARLGRCGFVVIAEHEIDPHTYAFSSRRAAGSFIDRATAHGLRAAAAAYGFTRRPAEQCELFPPASLGCLL